MIIRIVNNQKMYVDQIDSNIDIMLNDHFSARHPRIRFIDITQQSWDGYYRKYNSKEQSLALPFLNELKKLCDDKDIPYDVVDERPPTKPKPSIDQVKDDILAGVKLDNHQINAIKAAIENDIGLVSITTGGGKSEVMAGIAKLYDCPTVIIAEKRIVIEQLKERLELRDVIDEVGMFYGGSTPSGQSIVVGSIQSLASPPLSYAKSNLPGYTSRKERSAQFQKIVREAELLIVEECDLATSNNYKHLFKHCFKGRYRFGVSGTPFDKKKPVEGLTLREHLGNIIHETGRQELERIGRIIPVKCYMFANGEDGDSQDKMAFDIAEKELLVNNKTFHDKVVQIVKAFPNDGVLILLDTNNIEDLGINLANTIPGSVFIFGKTSGSVRKQAIKDFEDRKLKCLIGSKIIKRGLDLNRGIDTMIQIGGGKLWSEMYQRLGRALRVNDRGWARMISFYHLHNNYLYNHSKEQLKALVAEGYSVKVIFKNGIIDGSKLIKSRFRRPKCPTSRKLKAKNAITT